MKIINKDINGKETPILKLDINESFFLDVGCGKIFDITPYANISNELEFDIMVSLIDV